MTELEVVARRLGALAQRDEPLGSRTSYGVGGSAALLAEVKDEEQLILVARALAGSTVPVLLLGRGSNMLVADEGFAGLVVHPAGDLERLELPDAPAGGVAIDRVGPDSAPQPVVRAGAAVPLPVLARRTVDAGWRGLEWAVGVPGSVGGALRMNAGGHGSDVSASLARYRLVDLRSAEVGEGDARDLSLGYRSSSLSPDQAVVWAKLAVARGDAAVGRAMLSEIVRWRREHQPGGGNAGSVFVNPPPGPRGACSAGQLVEEAGLKGHRLGSAFVSPKHANFIQADRGGSANDVYRLMEHVRDEVAKRCGVVLRTEIRLIGFPTSDDSLTASA